MGLYANEYEIYGILIYNEEDKIVFKIEKQKEQLTKEQIKEAISYLNAFKEEELDNLLIAIYVEIGSTYTHINDTEFGWYPSSLYILEKVFKLL
jgi:hypothetical protein